MWLPTLERRLGPTYRALADAVADDLAAGLLVAGDRLPPQRELAAALGVTVATVGRAYREAARRGLVEATVGRGTVVVGGAAMPARRRQLVGEPPAGEPEAAATGIVDLAVNFVLPPPSLLAELLATSGGRLLASRMRQIPPSGGDEEDRAAGAAWLADAYADGVPPHAENVLVTAGGQHALLIALLVLTDPGEPILVERLTYPGIKTVASLLGRTAIPVPIDAEGVDPDALAALAVRSGARVVYLQPTLQNPSAAVMGEARRQAIAAVARRHRLWLLEDDVYGFLLPERPVALAALAPERTLLVRSATKALAPGVRVGYLAAPADHVPGLAAAIQGTVWWAAGPLVGLLTRWIGNGTLERVMAAKRAEVAARRPLVEAALGGLPVRTHPAASHVWVEVPPPARADDVVVAARAVGIALVAGDAFAVGPVGEAGQALRLCIGTEEDRERLVRAVAQVASLVRRPPLRAVV